MAPQKDAKVGKIKRKRRTTLQDEIDEITEIEEILGTHAPPRGSNPLSFSSEKRQKGQAENASGSSGSIDSKTTALTENVQTFVGCKTFNELPLSSRTKRGLQDSKYVQMTAIQRSSLPHSLCGRDVLGAAKTGSGKTLAFLIPVIEKLFRMRWGSLDGVGAIIISPTRELANQIFTELKKVGRHHSLSGGLLIGGHKEVEAEKDRVSSLNIIVCTPGRLLQHMDETPQFDCTQLQMLVLDEADRILDLGFSTALNAILANLPQRQTLLFSATQTRSVRDLARLSLHSPEFLAVHAEAATATPARLQQTVMLVPLQQKLDTLWSFVKTHLHCKLLVFLSSCKQTQFVFEAFKHLRPGTPLKCLHGRLKQLRRTVVCQEFAQAKSAVLFATDVAARGLDFPAVDWVVQLDCPEDVAGYIHRVGRTARFTASGRSLLLLEPSEQEMLPLLEAAKIPFKLAKANPSKLLSPLSALLSSFLSQQPAMRQLAQRAFVTYIRSIHLQSNKAVFDVKKLPLAAFAQSLGLPSTPKIRFLSKQAKARGEGPSAPDREEEDSQGEEGQAQAALREGGEEGFLRVKRLNHDLQAEEDPTAVLPSRSYRKRLKISEGNNTLGTKMVFDDSGNALRPLEALARLSQQAEEGAAVESLAERRFSQVHAEMRRRDEEDRAREKERLRQRRSKERLKARKRSGDLDRAGDAAGGAVLAPSDSGSEGEDWQEQQGGQLQAMREGRGAAAGMALAEQEARALAILSRKG